MPVGRRRLDRPPVAFRPHFGYPDQGETVDSNGTETSWVELTSGETVPIPGNFSIGRAKGNQLVLSDEKVSRYHALIRTLDNGESWIIDLASANGTYVNQRRIEHSMRLRDRDEISVGPDRLVFRSSEPVNARDEDGVPLEQTVHEVRQLTAWLFLVDIIDSTGISRQLGAHKMAEMFSDWLTHCRNNLEGSGGIIDKPLGDGFFAFWPTAQNPPEQVARAILVFKEFQESSLLPFRMVLHRGVTFTGGQMASGIYRLFGFEVNFTFGMEHLAKALKVGCLLSESAAKSLTPHVTPAMAGSYRVHGADDSLPFYRL
jgi:adenylate cyclase